MRGVRPRAMGDRVPGAARSSGRRSADPARRATMIYDEYLTQAELQRWILEADVAWARVDVTLARSRPDVLEQVHDSALIESYFPLYTTRLMRALWDQVDVTSVFSVQLYESYKHF